MWLAIVAALPVILWAPEPPLPGATRWFNAFLERSISFSDLAGDLCGISWHANSVLWSVQIEFAMIPLFPNLMYVSARLSVSLNLAFCAVLAAISHRWIKVPGRILGERWSGVRAAASPPGGPLALTDRA